MLNIAIIGCGVISKRHAELLGGNRIAGARLSAVCDINKDKAELLGNKFNVPAYCSMNSLMQKKSIDVLTILTPSGMHAKHVCEMAKYGKHIIVEKPMALNIDDANQMIDACNDYNCGLFVIKQNRFNRPVIKLKKALDEGRFGNLFMGTVRIRWSRGQSYYDRDAWRGTWDLDGGVLANQASHHLDLLIWTMGDVESVFAKSINAIANIDTEDTAVALVKFKNGALGLIEATTATRPNDLEGSLSILGDKASVVIGGFSANQLEVWNFS
jgi:predicted dehydrogenase